MSWLDRFRTTRVREPLVKAAQVDVPLLPVVEGYHRYTWDDYTFERLSGDASGNAAVFMCLSALTFGYNEPPPQVVNSDDEPQPKHALQMLLDRPNPLMSHAELMTYVIYYKAVGGNCYLHKRRNSAGTTIQLWPYHMGQIRPVPSRTAWIEQYEYYQSGMVAVNSERILIPADDIIHLKWPSVDLAQPWLALPPLRAIAQEVGSDTEMTRYIYALLVNDAVVRTVIQLPAGQLMSKDKADQLRAQFSQRHGGDKRGGVGVLEQGATIARMALNLQELAIEALRRIPEARIAGAFRVPAIVAGLYVGLEKATYANFQEAVKQMTNGTYVPLWKSDAVELTQSLIGEFGRPGERVRYNLAHVAALQEGEGERYTRILAAYDGGVVTQNEARAYIGYPKVGDIQVMDEGDVFKTAPAPMVQPPIDVTPVPPKQLTDHSTKARIVERKAKTTAAVTERMRKDVEGYFKEQYASWAAARGTE